MADEALVQAVKQITALAKTGDAEGANVRWAALFASPEFAGYAHDDQRQVLKFVILAKRVGPRPQSLLEVHRAAMPALNVLVAAKQEPADFELLGLCHQMLGEDMPASAIFRTALELERERSPGSDLCGRLMKHVSSL